MLSRQPPPPAAARIACLRLHGTTLHEFVCEMSEGGRAIE